MKKTTLLLVMLGLMMSAFSQAKLDYSAKPKSEAIGQSAKGLSAASARFLWQLRQAEAATDKSVKESLYAQLQRDYNIDDLLKAFSADGTVWSINEDDAMLFDARPQAPYSTSGYKEYPDIEWDSAEQLGLYY